MSKIKTITATTTEQTITFDATYQFVWFRSLGDGDVLVSDHSGIVAGTDDVALVKGGDSTRITVPYNKTVYVKAVSDSVDMEIHAQNFSDAPFEGGSGGGGAPDAYLKTAAIGNDGSLTLTKQDNTTVSLTLDATPTENSTHGVTSGGVYAALQNVGGFTRTVLYDSGAYNTPAPYQTDVNLSDNLSNYDIIAIVTGTQADNTTQAGYRYISEIFDVPMIQASKTVFMQSIAMRFCEILFTNTTFNVILNGSESSGYELQVYKIIGYKFG